MKNRRKLALVIAALILVFLSLLIVNIYIYINRDRVAPEFSYDNEVVILTEDQIEKLKDGDEEVLLEGVHAYDNEEGDITSKIIIQDVKSMYENSYMIVTYRVCDKGNNMASGHRVFYIIPPQELAEAVLTQYLGFNPFQPAEETEEDDEDDEIPVLKLKPQVVIDSGGHFELAENVIEFHDNKDTNEELAENVVISGTYDVNTPGIYVLTIYTMDSDGNASLPSSLQLIVK